MELNQKSITPDARERLKDFSPSAQKVLIATVSGLGLKEIAQLTNTSTKNVRNIRTRAFRKFQVKNSTEFVMKVFNPELHAFVKSTLEL